MNEKFVYKESKLSKPICICPGGGMFDGSPSWEGCEVHDDSLRKKSTSKVKKLFYSEPRLLVLSK